MRVRFLIVSISIVEAEGRGAGGRETRGKGRRGTSSLDPGADRDERRRVSLLVLRRLGGRHLTRAGAGAHGRSDGGGDGRGLFFFFFEREVTKK